MSDLPLLLLLVPVAGVILTVPAAWLGRRAVSFILLAAVASDLALAVAAREMSTHLSLATMQLAGQRFELALDVDALGALIVLLLPVGVLLITLATIAHESDALHKHAAASLAALAAANGLALAANLTTLYVFAESLSLILLIALATSSEAARRLSGLRMFATVEVCGLPLLLALAVLVAGQQPDDWSRLTFSQGLLSLGVTLSAVARAGLAPLQAWLAGALTKATRPEAALLALCGPLAGMIVLLRLLRPLALALAIDDTLLLLGIATLAVACYYSLKTQQRRTAIAGLVIAQLGFFAVGLAVGRPEGVHSALAALAFAGVTMPLLFVGLSAMEAGGSKTPVAAGALPNLVFVLTLLAAAGLPPFLGFQARLDLLQALLTSGAFVHILGMVAVLLASGVLAASAARIAAGALAEFCATETPWWPRVRLSALPLLSGGALIAAMAALSGPVQSWLLSLALVPFGWTGAPISAGASHAVAGVMLLLALFAGSLPLLSPGKPVPWPKLIKRPSARLADAFALLERWRERGLLDPANLAAQCILGIARGVASVTDAILGRLAI